MTGREEDKSVWDLEHVVLPVRRLVGDFELEWDKLTAVPDNDAMLDRLFQAGLELAALSGVFCISTGRVIHFSEEEIIQAMTRMPQRLRMGTGEDALAVRARGW